MSPAYQMACCCDPGGDSCPTRTHCADNCTTLRAVIPELVWSLNEACEVCVIPDGPECPPGIIRTDQRDDILFPFPGTGFCAYFFEHDPFLPDWVCCSDEAYTTPNGQLVCVFNRRPENPLFYWIFLMGWEDIRDTGGIPPDTSQGSRAIFGGLPATDLTCPPVGVYPFWSTLEQDEPEIYDFYLCGRFPTCSVCRYDLNSTSAEILVS